MQNTIVMYFYNRINEIMNNRITIHTFGCIILIYSIRLKNYKVKFIYKLLPFPTVISDWLQVLA